jgi:hypothetical protein
VQQTTSKVSVLQSTIPGGGFGVFANCCIQKGETLGEYKGVLNPGLPHFRNNTEYTWVFTVTFFYLVFCFFTTLKKFEFVLKKNQISRWLLLYFTNYNFISAK